jgi:hypothetical protein
MAGQRQIHLERQRGSRLRITTRRVPQPSVVLADGVGLSLAGGKPRVRGLGYVLDPDAAGLGDLAPQPDVGGGEQLNVSRIGGLEGREAGCLSFGLGCGVAAEGRKPKYPAG